MATIIKTLRWTAGKIVWELMWTLRNRCRFASAYIWNNSEWAAF